MLRCVPVLVSVVLTCVAAEAQDSTPRDSNAQGSIEDVEAWRSDLHLLATKLPELHPNWFARQSEEEWAMALGRVDRALSDMSVVGRTAALMELVARGKDGHTKFDWGGARIRWCPLGLTQMSDGLLITASSKELGDLVGRRLVMIAGDPVEDVMEKARPLVSCDNEWGFRRAVRDVLVRPALLRVLGLGDCDDQMVVVTDPGDGSHEERTIKVAVDNVEWVGVERPTPLYAEESQKDFWWRYLDTQHAVYFKYNKCRSPGDFLRMVNEVWEEIEDQRVDRFVVDFRDNGGGSSLQFGLLLGRLLTSKELNMRGILFGIIGPATFSSALLNATDMRNKTHAILVGEPTSGRPNHFGELRYLKLPGTGMGVWHSTSHFVRVNGDPDSLVPDLEVRTSIADYLAGTDPVLEAVFAWREDK